MSQKQVYPYGNYTKLMVDVFETGLGKKYIICVD